MNIHFHGVHLPLSTSLRSYLKKKTCKLDKHFCHHCDIDFTLSVEKSFHQIEASAHTSGKNFFCVSRSADMYQAINDVTFKLDRFLVKIKDRFVSSCHSKSRKRNHF
jgi:putative sigma-54 modulation protein